MDGDRKKRKMEEREEEKMEKMHALLKHAREMRKYLVSSTEREERKKLEDERAMAHRYPSFRPEGFLESAELNNTENAANAGSSISKKDDSEKRKEESEGNRNLDLNLSL